MAFSMKNIFGCAHSCIDYSLISQLHIYVLRDKNEIIILRFPLSGYDMPDVFNRHTALFMPQLQLCNVLIVKCITMLLLLLLHHHLIQQQALLNSRLSTSITKSKTIVMQLVE